MSICEAITTPPFHDKRHVPPHATAFIPSKLTPGAFARLGVLAAIERAPHLVELGAFIGLDTLMEPVAVLVITGLIVLGPNCLRQEVGEVLRRIHRPATKR